jgi:GH15 family glucan-1,4-alpha-glucosidase
MMATSMDINSGGGKFDQRSIVDAGFLELVRLGIRRADDPLIVKSLEVVDSTIKRQTPVGPGCIAITMTHYGERWMESLMTKNRHWSTLDIIDG